MRAVLVCLLLAGCGTTVEVQRVEVPIPVACVKRASVPAAPDDRFSSLPADAQLDASVQALLLDREDGTKYSRRLRALIEACVQ